MRTLLVLLIGVGSLVSVSAAKAQEDCAVIDMLPYLIDYPGDYCLVNDLTPARADGLIILAEEVVVDLRGFSINGPATGQGVGIFIGAGSRNVTIHNGTIRDYQAAVLSIWNDGHNQFEDLTILGSSQGGIIVDGNDNLIRRNRIEGTRSLPVREEQTVTSIFALGNNNRLIDNVIVETAAWGSGSAYGVRIVDSGETLVLGTRIVNTSSGPAGQAYGIHVTGSKRTSLEQNAVINLDEPGSLAITSENSSGSYCAGNYIAGYDEAIAGCYDGGGNTVR